MNAVITGFLFVIVGFLAAGSLTILAVAVLRRLNYEHRRIPLHHVHRRGAGGRHRA